MMGRIPLPGAPFGPCKEPCDHGGCAADRAEASALCGICIKPIGYEVPFLVDYTVPPREGTRLVHQRCLEEREQRANQTEAKRDEGLGLRFRSGQVPL